MGHDEATVQFLSNVEGSADNLQWAITLPKDPTPTQNGSKVASFELYSAFWINLDLCDPWSYPQNPCTPDSNSNVGGYYPSSKDAAGSATLNIDFFPPPAPWCLAPSGAAPVTEWCAQMNIFSQEMTWKGAFANPDCQEPINSAFIQMNGVPTGPAAPGKQNISTFETNSQTLLMNGGDNILLTIKDTTAGVLAGVNDTTTGQYGYMVASAANGFAHTNVETCQTSPFSFHPEFSSASASNISPWTVDSMNVDFAYELGHFLLNTPTCTFGSGSGCPPDLSSNNCYAIFSPVAGCDMSQDIDFTSLSYKPDWANGSSFVPTPLLIGSPSHTGIGPMSWNGTGFSDAYGSMLFTTIVAAEETDCTYFALWNCVIPPAQSATYRASFYPFYNQVGTGGSCSLAFGNDIPGQTTNDFGKDKEWGALIPIDNYFVHQGSVLINPCNPAPTMSVTCNSASVAVGMGVTCTSTVEGSPTPTGVVTWSSDGSGRFSASTCRLSDGKCSVRYTPSSAGAVTYITANYPGDKHNNPSIENSSFIVTMKSSTTSLSCKPTSAAAGSSKVITCKAKVEGYNPTGSVTWSQTGGTGSVTFLSSTCTLVKGACSVTIMGTAAGTVTIQAAYEGDANNAGSSKTASLEVT